VTYVADPHQEQPAPKGPEAAAAKASLQKVLDRYAAARPANLKAKDGKGYQDNMGEAPRNRRARKKAA
jgi:hypothetical protein